MFRSILVAAALMAAAGAGLAEEEPVQLPVDGQCKDGKLVLLRSSRRLPA